MTCCAHTPVLVHHEFPGLRKLCQVGQQRCQIVELCMLVVTFGTENVHQLEQANLLLKDLEKTKIKQICQDGCSQIRRRNATGLGLNVCNKHLENRLAGVLLAAQVGEDGADLIREQIIWIHEVFIQHRQNFEILNQHLGRKVKNRYQLMHVSNTYHTGSLRRSAQTNHLVRCLVSRQVDKHKVTLFHHSCRWVTGQSKQGSEYVGFGAEEAAAITKKRSYQ